MLTNQNYLKKRNKMKYIVLTEDQYNQLILPELAGDNLLKSTSDDLLVSTITAFGLFLSSSAKYGKNVAEIAKDGVKGIREWIEILKLFPEFLPTVISFYKNVIENAEEFVQQIKNMTPEQKENVIKAFELSFDIQNDKAEMAVETSIKLILEVITMLRYIK